MLCSIPGSRGGGSGLPGCCQINEVTVTQSPLNRSGCMLMEKQTTLYIQDMLPSRGALETAKVEGLWLSKDPNTCVETPR